MHRTTGRLVIDRRSGEEVRAYVPLPPEPPLELELADVDLLSEAERAVGRLDGLTALLPDLAPFLCFSNRSDCGSRRRPSVRRCGT